ncbi:MAG: histidine phosphatase family protein [Planctomycetota bacterium]
MGTRYLYLLRHGAYVHDQDHPDHGALTQRGRDQIATAAEALAPQPMNSIVSSTLPRAIESAAIAAAHFPAASRRRLRVLCEVLPGLLHSDLEEPAVHRGMNYRQLRGRLWMQADLRSRLIARCPQAGQRLTMNAQAEAALHKLVRPLAKGTRHELVVIHGNLIRYIWCRCAAVDPVAWSVLDTTHAGITRLIVHAGGEVVPLSYNEIGHLPLELRD